MPKVIDTLEWIDKAFLSLTQSGAKVTSRSVGDFVRNETGITPSNKIICDRLRVLKSSDFAEGSNRPSGSDQTAASRDFGDSYGVQALQEIVRLQRLEIEKLRATVTEQSATISRLSSSFADQVRSIAQDATQSLLSTVEVYHKHLADIEVDRARDKERWDGMHKFVMLETSRIRESETQKTQHYQKRVRELEQMISSLTQLKNQALDEASMLRARFGTKQRGNEAE